MITFFHRSKEQSTAAAAATPDRGVKVVGLVNVDRQTRLPRTHLAPGHRKRAGCEDGTAKLRWCYRSAVLFILSASATVSHHERASAAELLRKPRGTLSSSTPRHHGGEVTRILVIIRRFKFAVTSSKNQVNMLSSLLATIKTSFHATN